jgi:hypothetical protein
VTPEEAEVAADEDEEDIVKKRGKLAKRVKEVKKRGKIGK